MSYSDLFGEDSTTGENIDPCCLSFTHFPLYNNKVCGPNDCGHLQLTLIRSRWIGSDRTGTNRSHPVKHAFVNRLDNSFKFELFESELGTVVYV